MAVRSHHFHPTSAFQYSPPFSLHIINSLIEFTHCPLSMLCVLFLFIPVPMPVFLWDDPLHNSNDPSARQNSSPNYLSMYVNCFKSSLAFVKLSKILSNFAWCIIHFLLLRNPLYLYVYNHPNAFSTQIFHNVVLYQNKLLRISGES